MRYTFRQLEYFVAAGETGSITLASERIHISQPSISTAISHLERELGVQLFVRHHAQGLSLTPTGRLILQEAKRLVEQGEGIYALASEATALVRGRLNVGCFITLAPMIMPELTHSFTDAFPATQIKQMENSQEAVLDALRRAEVDIAITYDLQIPDEMHFEPLASLPPYVWVGEADPLAQQMAVTLEELAELPLVLLDLPVSRDYFFSLFMAEGREPLVGTRTTYQEVVRTMVANGYGYALANVRPRSDLALDGRRIVSVRLSGEHRPMRIGLATLKGFRKSRLVEAFEAHCRSYISDNYIPGMGAPVWARRTRL
ncbi:LysR family transcriptional regulator [Terrihabitans rhizophilus]|jgi:DNA-binding transcriptional LysR family regulator|uniref:LysR family transcriptional regulator n=1 Tax=Terrihabitans rhizophilus TaxID=3092662 RepID=A0ABU4RP89_9HYPH|nr:LysR family transcriptional regulator [Terrihabitans sp. PJ23]MDX6804556.1 LysR family transcriptional regulator [Terrihabitans sp. PJ23]